MAGYQLVAVVTGENGLDTVKNIQIDNRIMLTVIDTILVPYLANDADRLCKYLARFGLDWTSILDAR